MRLQLYTSVRFLIAAKPVTLLRLQILHIHLPRLYGIQSSQKFATLLYKQRRRRSLRPLAPHSKTTKRARNTNQTNVHSLTTQQTATWPGRHKTLYSVGYIIESLCICAEQHVHNIRINYRHIVNTCLYWLIWQLSERQYLHYELIREFCLLTFCVFSFTLFFYFCTLLFTAILRICIVNFTCKFFCSVLI